MKTEDQKSSLNQSVFGMNNNVHDGPEEFVLYSWWKDSWKPLRKRDKLKGKLVRTFDTHRLMYDGADTSYTSSQISAQKA